MGILPIFCNVFCLYSVSSVCVCVCLMPKRDSLKLELQTCGCWESKPGPLEGQIVLLTTEPSLQVPFFKISRNALSNKIIRQ